MFESLGRLGLYVTTATLSHQRSRHARSIYMPVLPHTGSHMGYVVVLPVAAEVALDVKLIRGTSSRVDQDGGILGLLGTASS